MPTLRSTLNALATNLASDILDVIRGASLEELLGESAGGAGRGPAESVHAKEPGRLARRSAAELAEALDRIVALVRKHKDGLRAEEIRVALGMQSKEMPRVLKEGLTTEKLKAKGNKRATTYTAAA
jgi:uncharacterized small protein (TIGR04563 family)